MTEYVDKPPYIAPEEPSGPCDWLESCWEPSTDWRRDPETRGFVPVCEAHSISTELRAPLDWVSLELSLALEAHLRDRDKWRAEVATLTTERDRYREALESVLRLQPRWLSIGSENNVAEIRLNRSTWEQAMRALAGTGETP